MQHAKLQTLLEAPQITMMWPYQNFTTVNNLTAHTELSCIMNDQSRFTNDGQYFATFWQSISDSYSIQWLEDSHLIVLYFRMLSCESYRLSNLLNCYTSVVRICLLVCSSSFNVRQHYNSCEEIVTDFDKFVSLRNQEGLFFLSFLCQKCL